MSDDASEPVRFDGGRSERVARDLIAPFDVPEGTPVHAFLYGSTSEGEWGYADVSGFGDEPGSVLVPLGPPLTTEDRAALNMTLFEDLNWTKMTRRGSKPCPPPMTSLRTKLRWYWNHWRKAD